MRRSAAPVSVGVKPVIGALCRLLAACGLDSVPAPETFRRAKFASAGEEDAFWQLLSSILLTAGIVPFESNTKLREERRKLVAAGLWQTGYYADWMYERKGGGEEKGEEEAGRSVSSRDLLLALGWLLAGGSLERLVTRRVQKLDQTLLTSVPGNLELSTELQVDSASLKRLQWLMGTLRHQGRILLSMLGERTRVLHAVLSASVSSPASSSASSSAVLKENCVGMRQLCDLLEAYLKWKQDENIFWTWMDSVMDGHLTDTVVRKRTCLPNKTQSVCHYGSRGLQKLEDMLVRLPTTQEEQGSHRVEVKNKDGERHYDGLGASSVPPLFSSLPSLPSSNRVYRPRLQVETPEGGGSSSRCPVRHPSSGDEYLDILPASEAAESLLHAEARLLQEREKHRLANRLQLQEMISRLDELVLIPP